MYEGNVEKAGDTVDNYEKQPVSRAASVAGLRAEMGTLLCNVDHLQPPEGLATGVDVFDDFLLWKGIPKGDLSLFLGRPGTGATSLWLRAAQKIHAQNKWVAWVNSDWDLMPSSTLARGLKLDRLLVVKKPKEPRQLFWILQELISSSLFEMVGCHLPEALLKNHQLQKLKKLARLHHVALVLVAHVKDWSINPLFSLVIECGREFFTVRRALHRPTPFTVSGNLVHADLLGQLRSIVQPPRRPGPAATAATTAYVRNPQPQGLLG